MCLQYEGSTFCGWQRQSSGTSIQGVLEETIGLLEPSPFEPINVFAAGRTDAGVHAAGQVVHFDSCGPIPPENWASALNRRLPEKIRVREAVQTPNDWHACYSARYRRYRYTILNSKRPNLFLAPFSWHRYQFRLDEELMLRALEGLIGLHDFYAFQRSGSARKNSLTTIQAVQLHRHSDLITIEIQATGFLYGMVRLLVAQLVALGEHRINLHTFERRWKERLRVEVKEAAPAKGLCLVRVGYEDLIFSDSSCFEGFPRFILASEGHPIDPPSL